MRSINTKLCVLNALLNKISINFYFMFNANNDKCIRYKFINKSEINAV